MTAKKTDEPKDLTPITDAAADETAAQADEAANAEAAQAETPKAPARSKKSVNLDKKLANQGTFAVGVQAMMRNRINKRG